MDSVTSTKASPLVLIDHRLLSTMDSTQSPSEIQQSEATKNTLAAHRRKILLKKILSAWDTCSDSDDMEERPKVADLAVLPSKPAARNVPPSVHNRRTRTPEFSDRGEGEESKDSNVSASSATEDEEEDSLDEEASTEEALAEEEVLSSSDNNRVMDVISDDSDSADQDMESDSPETSEKKPVPRRASLVNFTGCFASCVSCGGLSTQGFYQW